MVDAPLPLRARTIPSHRYQLLTSHNCNFQLTDCLQILSLYLQALAAGPRYIASARTALETPIPPALLLLHALSVVIVLQQTSLLALQF
jgi:hypothetical protein